MRRTARATLRTVALGGWAALALAAVPMLPGTALASGNGGQGLGATEGPARPHQVPADGQTGSRGDEPEDRDRGDDGAWTPAVTPVTAPQEEPAPTAAPETGPAPEPRSDIGTALGPVAGTGAAARTSAPEAGVSATVRRVPVLSIDGPAPFGPTSLAGRLRDAPRGAVVQVAIRRGSTGRGCGWWSARTGRFSATRRGGCAAARWITATTKTGADGLRWRAALGGTLPAGTHRYVVRVLGADGAPLLFVRI